MCGFAVKLGVLSARAAEVNVDAAALEAARDGDDPKSEIIALIMGRRGSATSKRIIQGP
jgi:hypothetical protein